MIVEENILTKEEKFSEFSKNLYLSLLNEGKSIYLDTRGRSMYPFIKNADRIKIVPADTETIEVGDIIAVNAVSDQRSYRINRKDRDGAWFCVHRVVRITRNNGNRFYFTKGDAHKRPDNPVSEELIIGRVTQIQRARLKINLELPIWRYLNKGIARLSLRYPRILHFLSRYIVLIVEWRLFLSKVKNRLKNGDPLIYNTEELLLICARKDLNAGLKKKAVELIREGLRWSNFSALAIRGGVMALVYNTLRTIAPDVRIPQPVLERLRATYLLLISRISHQYQQQLEILSLFAQKDIPVVPLKGTFLSKRLYGDIALRGLSVDFDLLIKEKDKKKARSLLQEIDYSFNPDKEIRQWQWHHDFFKSEATLIDLHWDVTMIGRSQERIEGFWKGSRLAEENGISFYEFKQEELLLYLSAHLVNSSALRQLRYICDINELLNKYRLDWDSLIDKAKRWRLAGSLYAALRLSHQVFGSPVPAQVWKKLKPSFLALFLIKVFVNKKVMLQKGLRRRLIDRFLSYILFELLEARSAKEYFSIFKRVFFPPQEAMGQRSYSLRLFKGIGRLFKKVLA